MAKLLLEIKINCKPTEGIYLIFRTSMTFFLDYCCQHFIEKLLNGKGHWKEKRCEEGWIFPPQRNMVITTEHKANPC